MATEKDHRPRRERVFRNWHAIAYYGSGTLGFALVGALTNQWAGVAAIPLSALLLAATRQHVIVDGTGVDLHNVVRSHRIALSEIDHLSVLYSPGWHYGWRIRLHCGPRYVDTFSFLNLAGFRLAGARFAAPPPDTPAPVKDRRHQRKGFTVTGHRLVTPGFVRHLRVRLLRGELAHRRAGASRCRS